MANHPMMPGFPPGFLSRFSIQDVSSVTGGNAKIIESDCFKSRNYDRRGIDRFEMINDMLVKQEMREDRDLLEDLDVYINMLHLFEENLSIL